MKLFLSYCEAVEVFDLYKHIKRIRLFSGFIWTLNNQEAKNS